MLNVSISPWKRFKIEEAPFSPVSDYVAKLRSVVLTGANASRPEAALARIKYCFVATDDYSVVSELTHALRNSSVPCEVYTLATENHATSRLQREDIITFLTELKLLVDGKIYKWRVSINLIFQMDSSLTLFCDGYLNFSTNEQTDG